MEDIIFIKTQRGDRTNIMAGFQLMDKDMLINDIVNEKKSWYGDMYRYGKIGGSVSQLKQMPLIMFDKVFSPNPFTPEQITANFGRDIGLKYGEQAEKAKLKTLSPKSLVRGRVYEDINGDKVLFLSIVKRETSRYGRDVAIEQGNGFVYWNGDNPEVYPHSVDILKGVKKLVKDTGDVVVLEPEYSETFDGYYHNSWTKRKLTLID